MNRCLVIARVLAALLALSVTMALAQVPRTDRDLQRKLDGEIRECVSHVRKDRPNSQFDAYAAGGSNPGRSQIRQYGSLDEQRQFEKCLTERGHPVK